MKYPLIAAKVAKSQWALKPEVFGAICDAVFKGAHFDAPAKRRAHDDNPDLDPYEDVDVARCEDDDVSINQIKLIQVFGVLGKHLDRFEMMCGGCSVDAIAKELKSAASDGNVEIIVLYFNSPGGMVQGIPELAKLIADTNKVKPVVGFCDGLCCSAALWLASQCDSFYVSPSSEIGSIGVYMLTTDLTGQMEQDGEKINAMVSGKFKLAGAYFKPLTDEERTLFQDGVDATAKEFRSAIAARWPGLPKDSMQGQTFNGTEWVSQGAADGLADDLDELLEIIS